MAKIVIIGAGLTGISAAYHLEKKDFHNFTIFEKESEVGGLCRSVQQDGFTFDYTGHLLHANDDYFRNLMQSIFGLENFNSIDRRSFIYSQDIFTRYPYQINLYGLPTSTIAECIEGFILRNQSKNTPKTFLQWVESNFGAGFAKHFFMPYQEKIFAYDLTKLTASWTGRFVPKTSLEQIINGALHDTYEPVGYNAQFLYPKKGGIIAWVQKLADSVQKTVITNCCVESINTAEKIITFTNGHHESYDHLISTMPLDHLLRCLKGNKTTYLRQAADKLICNSVINFNIGVNRPDLSDKHWIYYPEKKYPFYRIGFPHNFAESMAPAGCSSLYGEFAHVGKSPQWIHDTLKTALAATKKILNIAPSDIATEKIISVPHAYVIFDQWREKNVPHIHERLKELGIHSVGRYGQWKYSSMQEAVLDGKQVAEQLVIMPAKRVVQAPHIKQPHYQKDI